LIGGFPAESSMGRIPPVPGTVAISWGRDAAVAVPRTPTARANSPTQAVALSISGAVF